MLVGVPELEDPFGDGSALFLELLKMAEQCWASMSTRQIGQRLLRTSHWSTHVTWNKCMQGKRRTSSSTSNSEKNIITTRMLIVYNFSNNPFTDADAIPTKINRARFQLTPNIQHLLQYIFYTKEHSTV